VNENISEAEKKHWATFKPTEETSSDASKKKL
jgi:hypothetical protein